jgi:hypothetical protein
MITDIKDLRGKQEGDELTAEEFDTLVQAVQENQNSVKSVSLNNSTPVEPDENGNVNLVMVTGNYEQILTVKYGNDVMGESASILSADGKITLEVQYKESRQTQSGNDTIYSPTGRIVTLSISSASGTTITQLYSMNLASVGHSSTEFTSVDISPYLNDGSQTIQVSVTNTINAEPFNQNITIIKANLKLSTPVGADWFTNVYNLIGDTATSHTLNMKYFVQGNVEKVLHIEFKRGSSTAILEQQYATNVNSASTAQNISWTEDINNDIDFFHSWNKYSKSMVTMYSRKSNCNFKCS